MWISFCKNLIALALPLALTGLAQGQCPPKYQVQILYGPDCGVLGYAPTNLQAINDAGIACGAVADCGKGGEMVIWNGTQAPVTIPFPPGSVGAGPFGINEKNELAGIAEIPSGQKRGWVHTDNQSILLDTLPKHIWAEAYSIANGGLAVGFSSGGSQVLGVIWQEMQPLVLDLPIGPKSIAYDISDTGAYICGWMGIHPNPNGGASAFRWHNGDVVDLGFLPGTTSAEARGVNNLGQVCGIAYSGGGKAETYRHGFFWFDGVMQDIGILPGFIQCLALDVNDYGQVVGYCDMWPKSGLTHAVLWHNGILFDLNDLIPPELNLEIRNARGINNSGQIVAYATDSELSQLGVILTPIPSSIGDFDFNCVIDADDILGVLDHWHDQGGPADFTQDGIVNVPDLLVVIQNWTF